MAETVLLSSLLADTRDTIDAVVSDPGNAAGELGKAWPRVGDAVDAGVRKALDVDLFALLADGWRKAHELRGYADPVKFPPGKTVKMTLAKHPMTLDIDPELTLTLGAVSLKKLDLLIEFIATVEAATLTIESGAIRALELGLVTCAAKVRYGGTELPLPLKTHEIRVPWTVRLDPPVAIAKLVGGG